jgi:hypothetical protein
MVVDPRPSSHFGLHSMRIRCFMERYPQSILMLFCLIYIKPPSQDAALRERPSPCRSSWRALSRSSISSDECSIPRSSCSR